MKTAESFVPLLNLALDSDKHTIAVTIKDFSQASKRESKDKLFTAIKNRNDLISIKIEGYYFQDIEDAQQLAAGLAANPDLEEFHLDRNQFSKQDIEVIMAALKKCKKLKILNFTRCSINDDGAGIIADYVKEAPCLVTLILTNNFIGPQGTKSLTTALPGNKCIETFDLSMNPITAVGVTSLARTLDVNSSLKKLSLNDCVDKKDPCFKELETSLAHHNQTLCFLDLPHNINKTTSKEIEKNLERNRKTYSEHQKTSTVAKAKLSSLEEHERKVKKDVPVKSEDNGGEGKVKEDLPAKQLPTSVVTSVVTKQSAATEEIQHAPADKSKGPSRAAPKRPASADNRVVTPATQSDSTASKLPAPHRAPPKRPTTADDSTPSPFTPSFSSTGPAVLPPKPTGSTARRHTQMASSH